MRAAEDEELRRARERFQEGAVLADRVLPVEKVGNGRIGRRQELARARALTDVRLQHHRVLGRQRGHEIPMHRTKGLDEDIDFAATVEADRPGEVVADPVVKEAGRVSVEDRLRLLEVLALESSDVVRPRYLSTLTDCDPV